MGKKFINRIQFCTKIKKHIKWILNCDNYKNVPLILMHYSGIDKACLCMQVVPSLTLSLILEIGEVQSKETGRAVHITEFPLQSLEVKPN